VTWDDFIAATKSLADQIRRAYEPTRLIAISRGGWAPALVFSQLLDVKDLASIAVRYTDTARTKLEVWGAAPVLVPGDRALVIEDFLLSGKSLAFAVESIHSPGVQIKTAALGYLASPVVVPDFSLGPRPDAPDFPWEHSAIGE
jgi:hypoxanthine phosphoribosyltransferase